MHPIGPENEQAMLCSTYLQELAVRSYFVLLVPGEVREGLVQVHEGAPGHGHVADHHACRTGREGEGSGGMERVG